jgi:hypothetical protein
MPGPWHVVTAGTVPGALQRTSLLGSCCVLFAGLPDATEIGGHFLPLRAATHTYWSFVFASRSFRLWIEHFVVVERTVRAADGS